MKSVGFFVLVATLALFTFAGGTYAQESHQEHRLNLLAKQMGDSRLSQPDRSILLEKLASLKPEEVFTLRQLWRGELLSQNVITPYEARAFPALEKLDKVLFQRIQDTFGPGRTIFNTSPKELLALTKEILYFEEEAANHLNSAEQFFEPLDASVPGRDGVSIMAGGKCDYVSDWPKFVPAKWRTKPYYRGSSCNRVKNDPNEWPCDYRIYIKSRKYKEVDGLSVAAYMVVKHHGGLSASKNLDRFIIGYGSVILWGIPSEWWLIHYIIFRT